MSRLAETAYIQKELTSSTVGRVWDIGGVVLAPTLRAAKTALPPGGGHTGRGADAEFHYNKKNRDLC